MLRICLAASCLLLSFMLSACDLKMPHEPEFKHHNDKEFDAQTNSLHADNVQLGTESFTEHDSTRTFLCLLVLNPVRLPAEPDSLAQRIKHLAHLLAVDLKNPQDFEAVRVRIQIDHDYVVASTTKAQTFEFPIAALR